MHQGLSIIGLPNAGLFHVLNLLRFPGRREGTAPAVIFSGRTAPEVPPPCQRPGEPPRGCATSPNLSRRQAVECSLAIVPSQSFITGTAINGDVGGISATVRQRRMMGKVEEDERLPLDIAKANPDVLRSPEP